MTATMILNAEALKVPADVKVNLNPKILPTMAVREKATGERAIINTSDFNADIHEPWQDIIEEKVEQGNFNSGDEDKPQTKIKKSRERI